MAQENVNSPTNIEDEFIETPSCAMEETVETCVQSDSLDDDSHSTSHESGSIQKAFSPYFDEINRRSNVSHMEHNSKYFDTVETDGEVIPFKNEDQLFVLFSLSHKEFAPITEFENNPAVRIYGAFPDMESLKEHAQIVQKVDPNCSLMCNKTHEWIVAASCPAHMQNKEYIDEKRKYLLKLHDAEAERNKKDFEESVTEQKIGPISEKKEIEPKKNDIQEKAIKVGRNISRDAKIDTQKLVAISVIPDDTTTTPEFLFKIYACFENEKDADKYVRNTASVNVTNHNIDIVTSCSWIYPQTMKDYDGKKEFFRSTELDKIMKNYKSNPEDVRKVTEEHMNKEH